MKARWRTHYTTASTYRAPNTLAHLILCSYTIILVVRAIAIFDEAAFHGHRNVDSTRDMVAAITMVQVMDFMMKTRTVVAELVKGNDQGMPKTDEEKATRGKGNHEAKSRKITRARSASSQNAT